MKNQQQSTSNSLRGTAAMDPQQRFAVSQKGGQARAAILGHEGYSKMGKKGGQTRAEQLGHEGYVEMGKTGGQSRSGQLGHEGYAEMGKKGGSAASSKAEVAQEEEQYMQFEDID